MSSIVYLKKTRLYLAMKELFPGREICKLKDCTYRFHRGTEWLRGSFCDTEDNEFELCSFSCGNYLSFEEYRYDDYDDKRILINRAIINGFNKRGYFF